MAKWIEIFLCINGDEYVFSLTKVDAKLLGSYWTDFEQIF